METENKEHTVLELEKYKRISEPTKYVKTLNKLIKSWKTKEIKGQGPLLSSGEILVKKFV